jgi:succinate dehydrogenase/fumarate reductase flavoprotein subunit
MERYATDVLVIGGGSAAIRAAIEAAKAGVKVDLVDKGKVGESGSSPRALVGFAANFGKDDSDELFFQDWIRTSGKICDQNLVWEAVTKSRQTVRELEEMGLKFMRNQDGSLFLSRRAGHSVARGLMTQGNGQQYTNIVKVLRLEAEKRGVNFHEGIMTTRLFKKNGRVIGASGIDRIGDFFVFGARSVVLAAGGANRLYENVADGIQEPQYRTTGDAFSLAFYAGVPLIDMEFTQFRDSPPAGAIYGAKYLNSRGERFMEKYDPSALEKAPRYVVAAAVYREIMEGRGPIVWKVEGDEVAKSRAPLGRAYDSAMSVNIVLQFQRLMGGARIDARARTSVAGLFAAGESAGGVHGGDRMQSTGFLETQFYGATAGRNAAVLAVETPRVDIGAAEIKKEQDRITRVEGDIDPAGFTRTVQQMMWEKVGVVRNKADLQQAIAKFEQLRTETAPRLTGTDIFASLEAVNLLLTADMVARAGLAREETRSAHIRSDYPDTSSQWLKHVAQTCQDEDIRLSTLPVVMREK